MAFALTTSTRRTNRYRRKQRKVGFRKPGALINGPIALGAVFAVLIGINVYVFFFRGGTSIQDLLQAGAMHKVALQGDALRATENTASNKDESSENGSALLPQADGQVVKGSMKGHIGLASALTAAEFRPEDIADLIGALGEVLDFKTLQQKQTFEALIDHRTRKLYTFTYHVSSLERVVATRQEDGTWRAVRQETELEVQTTQIGGRIESSLSESVINAGGSQWIASQLVRLFGWDINWSTDPRPGDEFRLIVQKKYKDGEFWGYGRILAAEYRTDDRSYVAIYYVKEDGNGGYYSADGRSMRRAFLKTPLNFKRVSSHFNLRRFHPVLHRTKAHYGVDYAAPTGTPIWAASDGTVVKIGRFSGSGKMVMLKHTNGIKTVYMHMSRFARGLKRGRHVNQRQVIGYVGATGWATGPHLHYGIYVHGRPIDPQRFSIGRGALLARTDRARFLSALPVHLAALDQVPIRGGEIKLAQRSLDQSGSPDWMP